MSLSKPNSDRNRQVLPPPPGRQVSKAQGWNTFLQLTNKTGLTSTTKGGTPVIDNDKSPIPAMARIFNALPNTTPKDFAPAYRQFLVRK